MGGPKIRHFEVGVEEGLRDIPECPAGICWVWDGISISTKLWVGKEEWRSLGHAWVSLLNLTELTMLVKSHARLCFLNNPSYLGAVWPWQNSDGVMDNLIYKNPIPSLSPNSNLFSPSDSVIVGVQWERKIRCHALGHLSLRALCLWQRKRRF